MTQEANRNNEIYWELLRRTPKYLQFYEINTKTPSLTEEQKKFIEDKGKYSSSPLFYATFFPWTVASIMATKEFGVRFWKKGATSKNERSLFYHGVLDPPVAPIVSPNISFNQAPCEISFFPPCIELVECPDLGIPNKKESLIEEIERKATWKAEALFRVRINRPIEELLKDFEKNIRKTKHSLNEKGIKKSGMENPLFGKLFLNSSRKLRHDTFYRYLRWYDIYIDIKDIRGVSFRAVAYLSKKSNEEYDKCIASMKNNPDFVFPELGSDNSKINERTITKGIQIIYQLIHQKPLKSSPGLKKVTKKPPPLLKHRISLEKEIDSISYKKWHDDSRQRSLEKAESDSD